MPKRRETFAKWVDGLYQIHVMPTVSTTSATFTSTSSEFYKTSVYDFMGPCRLAKALLQLAHSLRGRPETLEESDSPPPLDKYAKVEALGADDFWLTVVDKPEEDFLCIPLDKFLVSSFSIARSVLQKPQSGRISSVYRKKLGETFSILVFGTPDKSNQLLF